MMLRAITYFGFIAGLTAVFAEDCVYVLSPWQRSGNVSILSFDRIVDPKDVGYSVDFFFKERVEKLQANDSSSKAPIATKISPLHWVVSKQKIPKMAIKRVQFELQTITEDEVKAKVVAVVFNSEIQLCGKGKSAVISPTINDEVPRKECAPRMLRYEHETIMTISESFYSPRVGVAVDIVFNADVENVVETGNFQMKRISGRHFELINSGYVTTTTDPIIIKFNVHHRNQPPPKVTAVVINDEVICGFTPVIEVLFKNASTASQVSTMFRDSVGELTTFHSYLLAATVNSAAGVLVVFLTGFFLVCKSKRSQSEEIYATPRHEKTSL